MTKTTIINKQAVSAIVRREDKFLLVKRMNPPSKGMYAFPGGRVEENEPLDVAVLRELREETTLIGTNPVVYATYDLTREAGRISLTVFTVEVVDVSGAKAQDDAEELGWFNFDEALKLYMPPSMIDCIGRLRESFEIK